MKIERIEAIPLAMRLPQPLKAGTVTITRRATIFTRVFTSEGVVGECFSNNENAGQKQIVSIIHDEIAPLLAGRDACDGAGPGFWLMPDPNQGWSLEEALRFARLPDGPGWGWHYDRKLIERIREH